MISKRSGLTRRRKDQKEMGSSSGEELVIEKALMPAPLFRGEQSDIGVKNVVFSSPKPRDLAPFLNCDICKGFLVSATTITNCLHSFCKSCLVKQMLNKERAPYHCPIRGSSIGGFKAETSTGSEFLSFFVLYSRLSESFGKMGQIDQI